MNSTEASGVSAALRSSLSPSSIKGTKINWCFFCRKKREGQKGGEKRRRGRIFLQSGDSFYLLTTPLSKTAPFAVGLRFYSVSFSLSFTVRARVFVSACLLSSHWLWFLFKGQW